MQCPACRRMLKSMSVDTISVDVCAGGCAGLWFDNYELSKVDEAHEAGGESLLAVERDPSVKIDPKRRRACPRCGNQVMLRHFASVKRAIEVDECPACGGIWLDGGEFGRLRSEYPTEQERSAAAKKYFHDVFGPELEKMRAESEASLERAQRFARIFRFICPSYWLSGKQDWGAF